MQNFTLYLPGFSHRLNGRRAQLEATRLRDQSTALDGLAALVARFIPAELFAAAAGQRERVYTPWVTFVSFLGQVLSRGSACREAVRRVQAWCVATKRPAPDENTSAYCQARGRLSLDTLRSAHEQLGAWIERHTQEAWRWCGRYHSCPKQRWKRWSRADPEVRFLGDETKNDHPNQRGERTAKMREPVQPNPKYGGSCSV